MNSFYDRSSCRTCNSKDLLLALQLQKSPLCDAYLKKPKEQIFYDLDLLFCVSCGLAQLKTVVDPEIIYRDYIYVTTSSTGLQKHFKTYAADVSLYLKTRKDTGLILDIGSNDGTLLKFFQMQGHKVLGVEPAKDIAIKATDTGIETLPFFFNLSTAKQIDSQFGKANLITINNLFANINDLEEFTKALDMILDQDGILVIETSYLLDMINNMVFDYIYHEHLSYFSICPLIKFFQKFNMKLVNLQRINTKGGSLRYYWARENSQWSVHPCVPSLISQELAADLSIETVETFQSQIDLVKNQLLSFLKLYQGKKIAGYGASATSTTLISHFGLDRQLTYLVDDNPAKVGTYSPGYHIPVFDSSRLVNDPPDLVIILAWRFREPILEKIIGIQCPIVLPLPRFEIANK